MESICSAFVFGARPNGTLAHFDAAARDRFESATMSVIGTHSGHCAKERGLVGGLFLSMVAEERALSLLATAALAATAAALAATLTAALAAALIARGSRACCLGGGSGGACAAAGC